VLPESDPARTLAAHDLSLNPGWYDGLPAAPLIDALAHAPCPANPLEAAPDDASRDLLAHALNEATGHAPAETGPPQYSPPNRELPLIEQVANALNTLARRQLERRQRELRASIAEADHRGDQAMLGALIEEKIVVDRRLREL
jgi:DNA primase